MKHFATFSRLLALALAVAALFAGWQHLFAWHQLGENYKAYYALKLFFAMVLLGVSFFALRERRYSGLHLLAISGTAIMLAGVQFVGLATQSILCSSPT